MSKVLRTRMKDHHERMIIMAFAENHEWDYDEGNLIEFVCDAYEDYEEYREWYLMMVA